MSQQIFCQKLQQQAEQLSKPPFPGEFGQKIFETISKPAWKQWLSHQTMLINEYRLSMIEPKARQFLKDEMQKFLFTENYEMPTGYTPE